MGTHCQDKHKDRKRQTEKKIEIKRVNGRDIDIKKNRRITEAGTEKDSERETEAY